MKPSRDNVSQFCTGAVRRWRRVLSRESGFTLIEMLIAMGILAIVSTPLVTVMTTATVTQKYARERTLAEQLTAQKVEWIRSLTYDQVGVVNGNPPGTIAASYPLKLVGIDATLGVQVQYVNDPTPTGYVSQANYKRVILTVTRVRDGKQLAKETTYVTPPGDGSFTPSGKGIIGATLLDLVTGAAVPGVEVDLGTGPSAPRSDVSDANGKVGFPQLTINPGSGSQAYYDLTIPASSGYATLDVPPSTKVHTKITANLTWPTTIQVYKPSTLTASLVDWTTGGPVSGLQVNLGTGLSAGATTVSDASGKASFAGIAPSTAGSPFYDLTVPASTGWTTISTDQSPAAAEHVAVGEGQTVTTSAPIHVYKPGVINVTLKKGSSTYNGATTFTISSADGSATYAQSTGTLNGVATFAGIPLKPNQTYTVGAQVGSGSSAQFAPAVASVVPASSYPGTTAQTYVLTLNTNTYTMRTLNVTVQKGTTKQAGARVDVTGGPSPNPGAILLTATTNSSGVASFSVPNSATATYTATAYSATGTTGSTGPFAVSGTTAQTVTVP